MVQNSHCTLFGVSFQITNGTLKRWVQFKRITLQSQNIKGYLFQIYLNKNCKSGLYESPVHTVDTRLCIINNKAKVKLKVVATDIVRFTGAILVHCQLCWLPPMHLLNIGAILLISNLHLTRFELLGTMVCC